MEWTKIGEQTSVPSIEVLALNEDAQEMMVGFIYIREKDQEIVCEDDISELEGVTHFIYKNELLKLLEDAKKT